MKTLKNILELGLYNKNGKQVFVIVKPGSLLWLQVIIDKILEAGWKLSMSKTKRLLLSEAKQLYKIHKKEDWYEPLCKYMSSDISMAMIFVKNGVSNENDFKDIAKIKDEIREKYGESDMRNVMHSSDSFEHMKDEAPIYFGIL